MASALGLTACDAFVDASQTEETPAQAAKSRFWQVFTDGAYADIDQISAELASAQTQAPEDSELVLLSAHAKLWRVVESARDPATPGSMLQDFAIQAGQDLARYQSLRPDDARVISWIAPLAFASASATGDQTGMQAAMDLADVGVAMLPGFNAFARLVMEGQMPGNHPLYARALDGAYGLLEARFGHAIVRDHAKAIDMTARVALGRCNPVDFNERPAPAHGRYASADPTCWNTWLTPHEYEGLWLYLGDAFLKGRHFASARQAYRNATLLPSFARWAHADLVRERLAKFDTVAANVSDDDLQNDPAWVNQSQQACGACHSR